MKKKKHRMQCNYNFCYMKFNIPDILYMSKLNYTFTSLYKWYQYFNLQIQSVTSGKKSGLALTHV